MAGFLGDKGPVRIKIKVFYGGIGEARKYERFTVNESEKLEDGHVHWFTMGKLKAMVADSRNMWGGRSIPRDKLQLMRPATNGDERQGKDDRRLADTTTVNLLQTVKGEKFEYHEGIIAEEIFEFTSFSNLVENRHDTASHDLINTFAAVEEKRFELRHQDQTIMCNRIELAKKDQLLSLRREELKRCRDQRDLLRMEVEAQHHRIEMQLKEIRRLDKHKLHATKATDEQSGAAALVEVYREEAPFEDETKTVEIVEGEEMKRKMRIQESKRYERLLKGGYLQIIQKGKRKAVFIILEEDKRLGAVLKYKGDDESVWNTMALAEAYTISMGCKTPTLMGEMPMYKQLPSAEKEVYSDYPETSDKYPIPRLCDDLPLPWMTFSVTFYDQSSPSPKVVEFQADSRESLDCWFRGLQSLIYYDDFVPAGSVRGRAKWSLGRVMWTLLRQKCMFMSRREDIQANDRMLDLAAASGEAAWPHFICKWGHGFTWMLRTLEIAKVHNPDSFDSALI